MVFAGWYLLNKLLSVPMIPLSPNFLIAAPSSGWSVNYRCQQFLSWMNRASLPPRLTLAGTGSSKVTSTQYPVSHRLWASCRWQQCLSLYTGWAPPTSAASTQHQVQAFIETDKDAEWGRSFVPATIVRFK